MPKMLYIIWTENGFVVAKLKYSLHRGIGRVSTLMPNMCISFLDGVLRCLLGSICVICLSVQTQKDSF